MKRAAIGMIVLLAVCAGSVCADQVMRTARVQEVSGIVEVKIGSGNWKAAMAGTVLQQGDFIRTKAKSSAVLKLEGQVETAEVEVQPNSQLLIRELKEDKTKGTQNTLLDLAMGKVLVTAQKLHAGESKFEVKTPTSIVGIRGTIFEVGVEEAE